MCLCVRFVVWLFVVCSFVCFVWGLGGYISHSWRPARGRRICLSVSHALHYIALRCIAWKGIALHRIAPHFAALHCIAQHCIALHCIAQRSTAQQTITRHWGRAVFFFDSFLIRYYYPWPWLQRSLHAAFATRGRRVLLPALWRARGATHAHITKQLTEIEHC